MKGLLDRALDLDYTLLPGVMGNFLRILHRHDLGVRVSAEEIAAIVAARRVDVAAEVAAVAGEAGGGGLGAKAATQVTDPRTGRPLYTMVGAVAVISIGGVLMKYSNQVNGSSQPRGTSVEFIRGALATARADAEVASILVVIDSPGGSVMGMATLADEIRETDQRVKPVFAYCDDLCASGGYYIASQARVVYSSASAVVGSIGVYTVLVDSSAAAHEQGLKVSIVSAGKYKGALEEGVAITEDAKGEVKQRIDAFYEEFVTRVERGRTRLTSAQVRELADGRVWVGEQAVRAGLVDAVRPLGQVLAEMNSKFKSKSAGGVLPSAAGGSSGTVAGSDQTGQEKVMKTEKTAAELAAEAGKAGDPVAGTITAEQANQFRAEGAKAEAARVSGINALAAKFSHVAGVAALVTAAAADPSVTPEKFSSQLIDKVADGTKPLGVGQITVGEDGAKRRADAITLMLVDRAMGDLRGTLEVRDERANRVAGRLGFGDAKEALKAMGDAESNGLRSVRLTKVAEMCVAAADPGFMGSGIIGPDDTRLWQRAINHPGIMGMGSHTTSDFPSILGNVANKTMMASFEEVGVTWSTWCATGTAVDYKDAELISLSSAQDLMLILEGEAARKASFSERKASIAVKPYGRRFDMTYQMWRNDDLSAFAEIPRLMGQAARRLPDALAYQLLELDTGNGPLMAYDSVRMINSAHNNDLTGALSMTALEAGFAKMRLQTGFNKEKTQLSIVPRFLVVPPGLEFTAERLRIAEFVPGTGSDNVNVPNVLRNKFQVVVADRARASTTRWWLAGDKANASIEVRFLDGQQTPRLDQLYNGDPLNMGYQVTLMGVGAAARNHENIASSPGT
jgi:signal peptide peptidase SppA